MIVTLWKYINDVYIKIFSSRFTGQISNKVDTNLFWVNGIKFLKMKDHALFQESLGQLQLILAQLRILGLGEILVFSNEGPFFFSKGRKRYIWYFFFYPTCWYIHALLKLFVRWAMWPLGHLFNHLMFDSLWWMGDFLCLTLLYFVCMV